jgi:ribonuclease HI
MEKLVTLLRRIAEGATVRDAWVASGYRSFRQARRAIESLAESLDTNERPPVPGGEGSAGDSAGEVRDIVVYTDGASRGNPGPSAVAAVAYLPSGDLLTSVTRRIGHATNNVAEYRAVLEGLDLARRFEASRVVVRLDSELVVRQLNGVYRIKSGDLKPLAEEVLSKASSFETCTFEHIPRSENTTADRLASRALDSPGNRIDPE